MKEEIILVNESGKQVGVEDKIKVHQSGKLHRAFSVFIFNSQDKLLLQKRAITKYHSGGLWSNTCCGHPRPNENTENAAHRRLKEEMGFDCHLKEIFSFTYKKKFDNGLTEHEYDHVFIGRFDSSPNLNPVEANEWKWANINWLKKDIKANSNHYTDWFKICFDRVIIYLIR